MQPTISSHISESALCSAHQTPGETALYHYLEAHLAPSWSIYHRPYLNGDSPNLAVFNPLVGLLFFEVKEWDLTDYYSTQEGRFRRYYTHNGQQPQMIIDPLRQVERYRENLINLYMPKLAEAITAEPRILAAIRVGLYFHNATTAEAQSLMRIHGKRATVFGQDALIPGKLLEIVPDAERVRSFFMQPAWEDELRWWLAPPKQTNADVKELALTDEQRRHVEPAPGRHQRLHGVAGSGKTLVIAQRAANLAASGKRVLIVTYNSTLWQYIRTLMMRTSVNFDWRLVEFQYFHGFCKNFLLENGVPWPHSGNRSTAEIMDGVVPQLVMDTLQAGRNERRRLYDAILIDEGQDFPRSYYDTLCHFLTENDEILFVADRQQNVYHRDGSWLEKMRGTKFRGRWREMKVSYRLPPVIAAEANRFATQFLPHHSNSPVAVEELAGDDEPYLAWHNVENFAAAQAMLLPIVLWLHEQQQIAMRDIVVLAPNQREGWSIAEFFATHKISTNHIFTENDAQVGRKRYQYRKRSFVTADPRLKISTIHGFKGWELNTVILLTPKEDRHWEAESAYLFYVAMTRTRQNLIVLNRHLKFKDYGLGWAIRYGPAPILSSHMIK